MTDSVDQFSRLKELMEDSGTHLVLHEPDERVDKGPAPGEKIKPFRETLSGLQQEVMDKYQNRIATQPAPPPRVVESPPHAALPSPDEDDD